MFKTKLVFEDYKDYKIVGTIHNSNNLGYADIGNTLLLQNNDKEIKVFEVRPHIKQDYELILRPATPTDLVATQGYGFKHHNSIKVAIECGIPKVYPNKYVHVLHRSKVYAILLNRDVYTNIESRHIADDHINELVEDGVRWSWVLDRFIKMKNDHKLIGIWVMNGVNAISYDLYQPYITRNIYRMLIEDEGIGKIVDVFTDYKDVTNGIVKFIDSVPKTPDAQFYTPKEEILLPLNSLKVSSFDTDDGISATHIADLLSIVHSNIGQGSYGLVSLSKFNDVPEDMKQIESCQWNKNLEMLDTIKLKTVDRGEKKFNG